MSRIAVVGAGAVGCYYGARLAEAGHEVHFLMRRDYDAVAAGGLHVASPDGDLHLEHPHVHRTSGDLGSAGPFDWVIVALKATAIEEARDLVAPAAGDAARILVLMNGLGLEDRFAEWFGGHRIHGGLAFTCINRGEPGRVHHLDYGPVTLGHHLDDPAALDAARALWDGAKVEVTTSPCLLAARWIKLCWNIPFNGLAVTAGGVTTDVITGTPALRAEAEAIIRETIRAGNADLAARGFDARIDEAETLDSMITRTQAMAVYRPSTMIDYLEGRSMEVDAIFGEPVRRARTLAVDTPRLTLLHAQMQALDARRGG